MDWKHPIIQRVIILTQWVAVLTLPQRAALGAIAAVVLICVGMMLMPVSDGCGSALFAALREESLIGVDRCRVLGRTRLVQAMVLGMLGVTGGLVALLLLSPSESVRRDSRLGRDGGDGPGQSWSRG
jgi:hypothetical protein